MKQFCSLIKNTDEGSRGVLKVLFNFQEFVDSEENSPIISCPKGRIFILSLLHVQVSVVSSLVKIQKCPAQKVSGQEPACQESRVR